MKRALLLAIAILFITALPAQIDTDLANLLEEGYSVQEMDKIFSEVNYNNHKKWLKNAGYTYVKDKSTSNYFYYDKNAVVTLLLVHENKEIQDVLFHSSPQKTSTPVVCPPAPSSLANNDR